MADVPLTMRSALATWQLAPFVSAMLAVAGAGYLIGVWRVGRRHPARPWPAGRTLAFLLGLAVIVVATQSSIGAYDDVGPRRVTGSSCGGWRIPGEPREPGGMRR
jgi:cytochrome c oxidase assembly factor CtaG